ncbi:flagellar basal body-associated protein FliL [Massilia sp.]|uniref:flagellar basal body-associated protein FliL n=1 Tax=Massilia sp. TaxID=1882437 RepID=UPI002898A8EF|nr:flagellar basal body-associated protein FliL [Massilia sp.]
MKADPKADAAAAAPAGSKKKLIIMILAAILVLGAGAGGGWYFSQSTAAHGEEEAPAKEHKKKKKKDPEAKPEYVPVEAFTVNLQPENGEQYLQVQFTLQVAGAEQATLVKDNMAVVRNRVLLLLSGKKASEINTVQGKQQLATEIKESITEPFEKDGDEQEVSDVLFTSFIIQ